MKPVRAFATLAFAFISSSAFAADYPAPKHAEWVARDFRFHTGEVLPELRISYTTVGEPTGQAGAGAARHDRQRRLDADASLRG